MTRLLRWWIEREVRRIHNPDHRFHPEHKTPDQRARDAEGLV